MASNIFYLILAFFIIGAIIACIGLLLCRVSVLFKGKKHSFKSPAKFKPTMDLTYDSPPESVDKSNATRSFMNNIKS